MAKMYIAIMNPAHEEALSLQHILDEEYKVIRGNKYGVRVSCWSRDKVEFIVETEWTTCTFWADHICNRAWRRWVDEGHDENADISWGTEPQEYRNGDHWDVSPEDYAEWVAASCGEC